jgi:ParB-like chromosome segregation protein Spo0J
MGDALRAMRGALSIDAGRGGRGGVKILNEATELVALNKLKPHPKNPRQGDVGAIHVSIEANGFWGSVIAQKSTGHILAGNHRFLAAKHANADEIPVTWVDVTDEEALRILLADNRTNDLASYNDEALAELLDGLLQETGTLDGTGYDGDDLDELIRNIGDRILKEAPEEFEEFDAETIKTEHKCPSCGYEWSGGKQ